MCGDYQDRIEAYLRGEMSESERERFESDLKKYSSLRNEYIITRAISNALADRARKLALMEQWDREEEMRMAAMRRKKALRRWAVGLGAAACVAAGFFALRPVYNMSSAPDGYVMPDFGNAVYTRSADNSTLVLDSMIVAKDYKKALVLADSLAMDYMEELRQFDAADSLSERDAYHKLLGEVRLSDVEWRRANLLIVLGRVSEARKCLMRIGVDSQYHEQADSLLRSLPQK